MKKLFFLGLVLLLSALAFGQTAITSTTLSASVSNSNIRVINVASATGITAASATDMTKATILYVDREAMDVQAVNGTSITVRRGANKTTAAPHASAALVFIVPVYLSTQFGTIPQGSCTRSNELALPRIEFVSGTVSDCLGGQWVNGDAKQTQRASLAINEPPTGGTAYTALETDGTAPGAATEEYCTQIMLPYSKLLTGLAVLNGTVVGTDKHLVILRDASGIPLANSATAGALAAGASTYQKYAFTSPYYAVGPAVYWGCVQTNGTTATIRHAATSTNDNRLAGKLTGQTFGTIAAAPTMPTTFTTVLGPYFQLY